MYLMSSKGFNYFIIINVEFTFSINITRKKLIHKVYALFGDVTARHAKACILLWVVKQFLDLSKNHHR